jgi:predicted O-methyltransferase YrrM
MKQGFQEALLGIQEHIWSSEPDVSLFLRSLIGMTRATNVVECGVFKGYTAINIINDLPKDSLYIGIDIDDHREESVKKFMKDNDSVFIKESSLIALDRLPARSADIIYIDSVHELSYLREEFKKAERVIKQNGFMILHDTNMGDIKEWVYYLRKLAWFEVVTLPTSRDNGLGIVKCLMV